MNLEIRPRQERPPMRETIAWNELDRPLVLGFADELGAVFADEERGELWQLDINEMRFSRLHESDLSEARAQGAHPLKVEEGKVFRHGVEAALALRGVFLRDQRKVFEVMKEEYRGGDMADVMMQAIDEELDLLRDYRGHVDQERAAILEELDEIYQDMQVEEEFDEPMAAK